MATLIHRYFATCSHQREHKLKQGLRLITNEHKREQKGTEPYTI
jgi:hypothetical protein